MRTLCLTVALLCSLPACATAQFKTAEPTVGPRLDRATTQRVRIGVTVKAAGGPCKGVYATLPVPMEWPEQTVKIVEEDVSSNAKLARNRLLGGTVTQMIVEIPQLATGQEARAVVTYEVTRRTLLPPEKTEGFQIPAKPGTPLRVYLGTSPYIESTNGKIVSLAREITADKSSAWDQVEAIYDWVRENVEYKTGELKGAARALADKTGDCEELTSLFVALCRAHKVPARCVWVDGHCYPEFYLQDADGNGHWFPCQAAGSRSFGGIEEVRAILQKGDNFKDPDRRERQRYVSEFLKVAAKSAGPPKVKFIREVLGE